MSQSGIAKITTKVLPPEVPTSFVTDSGTAIPLASVIEILGGSNIQTSGLANIVTVSVSGTTNNAVQIGNASGSLSSLSLGTNGQVLIGATGIAPAFSTITSTDGSISFTTGPNSLDMKVTAGSSVVEKFAVQTGTSPVIPAAGIVTFNGGVVSAGTNPVKTDGVSPSSMTLEVQRSQAIASTDATKVGLSVFDSADFTVDANGFVSVTTTGIIKTLTGNSGGAIAPVANNINTVGSGSITISGSGSTLTTQLSGLTNHNVLIGAGTSTITNVAPSATALPLVSGGASADPSFAILTVPGGGTGRSTITSGTVLSGNGSGNVLLSNQGTAGQVFVAQSTSTSGQYITPTAGAGLSITTNATTLQYAINSSVVGQTITGDSGGALSPTSGNWNILGSGSTVTSGSVSTLTVQLTGLTNHALQVGAGTATLTQLGAGTTGQVLQTNTTADPTWSTATYPSTTTVSQILYSSATNTVTGLATANNGTLITGTTGIPVMLANGTTGQVLTATTGSPPSWVSSTTSGTVTSVSGTANQVSVATGTTTPVISLVGPYTPATYTAHGVLIGEGTSSIVALVAGSAGQILRSGGGAADPSYSTSTYPATNAINTLLYASAANVMSALATANSGVLITDSSGVPSISNALTIINTATTLATLTSTDAGAGAGPIIDSYRNSASPAAADVIGQYILNGVDSAANKQEYARIEGKIISTTSTAEKGELDFYTMASGTATLQVALLDTGGQYRGNNTNTAPPAGYIGEQISSAVSGVSVSNATAKSITSISITAGIWNIDILARAVSSAANTNTLIIGSSATDNTFEGNFGDKKLATITGTATQLALSIPAFRLTLTSTTTYYLVVQSNFTGGTCAADGRISATRVG